MLCTKRIWWPMMVTISYESILGRVIYLHYNVRVAALYSKRRSCRLARDRDA